MDDREADDARWDRLLDARDALLCDLGAITTEADEIVWDLDGQLAEVDHDAVVEALDEASAIAEFGDVSGARQQRRHAQACAAELRPTVGLWRDVLEGALNVTGRYPGVTGQRVAHFTAWLDGPRRPGGP